MSVPAAWAAVLMDDVRAEARKVLHILVEGQAADRDELSEAEQRALVAFFNEFEHRAGLPRWDGGLAWDLDLRRRWRLPIALTTTVDRGTKAPERKAYLLGSRASQGGWSLLVHNPIAAASVLRAVEQIKEPDEEQILEECVVTLIRGGFAFMTALPWDPVRGSPDADWAAPRCEARMWLDPEEGHEWTQRDFTLYQQRVRRLLYSGRGKEALRMGGIVAYIASQFINGLAAVRGPATDHEFYPRVVNVGDTVSFTDRLTPEELDVITGTFYTRSTEPNDNTEYSLSYWPPPETWAASRFGGDCWTPLAQEFVEQRECELREAPAPATRTQWKDQLRKYRGRGSGLLNEMTKRTREALDRMCRPD
jgi:hypothetical protein